MVRVHNRICRARRGRSFVGVARSALLAFACAVALTAIPASVALADPGTPVPPPAPAPAGPPADEPPDASLVGPEPIDSSPEVETAQFAGAVTLSPTQGGPGSSFTARAVGFLSCGTIVFTWDDGTELGSSSALDRSGVSVGLTVPPDTSAATHTVIASCGKVTGSAPFTVIVPEKAQLALSPEKGSAGTQVTATTAGFGSCSQAISLQWDGQPLPASAAMPQTFEVPAGATPVVHTVTATCGDTHAEAAFTVESIAKPTLTLSREQGPRGSELTASGTGFACDGDQVRLLWDGETVVEEGLPAAFTAQMTVPDGATTGAHTVVAACRDNPDITATRAFTVVKDTLVSAQPASLSLDPVQGNPGDQVRVTGDGFTCDDHSRTVELVWDDGSRFTSPSADGSGHLTGSVTVPLSAAAGGHTVTATCSDGSAAQSTGFTVLAAGGGSITSPPITTPPISPPPGDGGAGWLVVLLLAALLVAGIVAYRVRQSRSRRQRHDPDKLAANVTAVSRPGEPPVITMREASAPGEATHAVALKTHSDLGTLTIREVDDDSSNS